MCCSLLYSSVVLCSAVWNMTNILPQTVFISSTALLLIHLEHPCSGVLPLYQLLSTSPCIQHINLSVLTLTCINVPHSLSTPRPVPSRLRPHFISQGYLLPTMRVFQPQLLRRYVRTYMSGLLWEVLSTYGESSLMACWDPSGLLNALSHWGSSGRGGQCILHQDVICDAVMWFHVT